MYIGILVRRGMTLAVATGDTFAECRDELTRTNSGPYREEDDDLQIFEDSPLDLEPARQAGYYDFDLGAWVELEVLA